MNFCSEHSQDSSGVEESLLTFSADFACSFLTSSPFSLYISYQYLFLHFPLELRIRLTFSLWWQNFKHRSSKFLSKWDLLPHDEDAYCNIIYIYSHKQICWFRGNATECVYEVFGSKSYQDTGFLDWVPSLLSTVLLNKCVNVYLIRLRSRPQQRYPIHQSSCHPTWKLWILKASLNNPQPLKCKSHNLFMGHLSMLSASQNA